MKLRLRPGKNLWYFDFDLVNDTDSSGPGFVILQENAWTGGNKKGAPPDFFVENPILPWRCVELAVMQCDAQAAVDPRYRLQEGQYPKAVK